MPTKVIVPLLGEGVEEVTIVTWLKSEGETVDEYEGLVEVETDKVVTEIPSPVGGTVLKIMKPEEGSAIPVGAVLAWIGNAGEAIPEDGADAEDQPTSEAQPISTPVVVEESAETVLTEPAFAQDASPIESAPTAGRDANLGFISPVVAKIAAENRLDLSQVKGSGLNGRITKKDVLAALETRQRTPSATITPSPAPAPAKVSSPMVPGKILPLSTVRKRIAEHMVMSKRTSAHVTTLMEADMSRVAAHRQVNKVAFEQDGARLTFTAYFVSATAVALKAFPLVNSSWTEEGLLLHDQINIGMATDLGDEGLIVPVIKKADELSLLGIARAVNDLANRARSKKLNPADVQDATFSITNHGVTGSLMATPIINQPQCAILGVGVIEKRVVVVPDEFGNDSIAIRPMIYLTLTFDHRIIDGAGADRFLAKVIETLEQW